MSNIKQVQKQYWEYYKTWMKEHTYCAILKQEILITRKGWDHITSGRSGRRRKAQDVYRRLKLLKMAKHIITKADKYSFDRREGTTYLILTKNYNKNSLKVVLKKNNKGKYYFFSVMDK